MPSYKTLLVGIDLHEGSAGALQSALRIGTQSQARIHALYVIEDSIVHDLQVGLKRMEVDLLDSLKSDARAAWKQFTQDMPEAGAVSFDVQIAHPAVALTKEAERLQADLLVLGTEKPGRVGATVLEMACLRKSPCDVLIARQVPPEPFKN
ncbi:MAG TPA: universal stress protein, partial [Tepidisphaeraceae bacterium]|nr:universal stress protein [Tepidisphaeraceae bacterium]